MRPLLLALVLLLSACSSTDREPSDQTLILISFDGFRADYLDTFDVPNLRALAAGGVWARDGIKPVFPSKTFPNHYAIATGLYPANNGIVANTMYDERRDAWFRISDRDAVEDPYWWDGEPIWVTAELQGMTAATYFWVGSEAPVKGVQPTYWFRHDASVPGAERVDQVLDWLDLPESERPQMITLYFSGTDTAGHIWGPHARRTGDAIEAADRQLGRLLEGLERRGIRDETNLVLVSDHGMAEVDPDQVVYLEDYLDRGVGRFVDYSPVLAIRVDDDDVARVRRDLSRAPGLDVLSDRDLAELNYTDHWRIPSVIALAHEGWTIYSSRAFHRQAGPANPGNHGYHPDLESMRSLFIANGPAFKNGLEVEPFENVHLYELMTRILGLTPAPNDGDPAVTQSFLR
ncbi:MAG: sulfatase-like hydrolase/transferase [Rhodothermales bacterium]|nr:sulfatase-like hydrolase/transferase [Rhodothermales bacterium]